MQRASLPSCAPRPSGRGARGAACAAAALVLIAGAAPADPGLSGPAPDAAVHLVEALHAAMLGVMKQGKQLGYEGRREKLEPAIAARYDFAFIAEKSVGPAWKSLDPAQRAKLIDAITRLAGATYAARMADWDGQRFETLGTETASADTVLVRTRVVEANGDTVPLDYRVRVSADGPRIIDVFYNGTVSELALRRSEYTSLLKRGGYDALLAALEQKIADQASAKPS